jgi:hypothetical protein
VFSGSSTGQFHPVEYSTSETLCPTPVSGILVIMAEQETESAAALCKISNMVSASGEEWDARAEYDLGVFMRRYLHDHPPSVPSALSRDFEVWSENLSHDGQARLAALGARRLRAL